MSWKFLFQLNSLWDLTHLKENKSVVWVEPMLCVGWPQIFGKTPLLLKKKIKLSFIKNRRVRAVVKNKFNLDVSMPHSFSISIFTHHGVSRFLPT